MGNVHVKLEYNDPTIRSIKVNCIERPQDFIKFDEIDHNSVHIEISAPDIYGKNNFHDVVVSHSAAIEMATNLLQALGVDVSELNI